MSRICNSYIGPFQNVKHLPASVSSPVQGGSKHFQSVKARQVNLLDQPWNTSSCSSFNNGNISLTILTVWPFIFPFVIHKKYAYWYQSQFYVNTVNKKICAPKLTPSLSMPKTTQVDAIVYDHQNTGGCNLNHYRPSPNSALSKP